MASISQIHRSAVLEHTARRMYSEGTRPSATAILRVLSEYFLEHPPGRPLPTVQGTNATNLRSDPDAINESMANAIMNLSLLFRANHTQAEEIMEINTLLRTHLDKLAIKRKRLINQVDDYLLSLYNSDGYYFSVSDGFSDLRLTALELSNSFVDVTAGKVTLPITKTQNIDLGATELAGVKLEVSKTRQLSNNPLDIDSDTELLPVSFNSVGDLSNAFDGLSNTVWSIEIETTEKTELIVDLRLNIQGAEGFSKEVSRIEFDTYGISPVQLLCYTVNDEGDTPIFGPGVITTDSRAVLLDTTVKAGQVGFRLRKTEPDYTYTRDDNVFYKYVFGAKEIHISRAIYDRESVFVSKPIRVSDVYNSFIDAVSLDVVEHLPEGTSINYFVAKDDPQAITASSFDWHPITPVQNVGDDNKVVRFNSTTLISNFIRRNPTGSEYQLTPISNTPSNRNPSGNILTNGSVYRITEVDEDFILGTLSLEEGFNTVRILYKNHRPNTYRSLDNWKEEVLGNTTRFDTAYQRIDNGEGFFSGVSIAEAYKSFYIETYLDSSADRTTIIRDCNKSTPQTRVWDMKIFLNGEEIADMPAGVDSLPVAWKFNKGLNHIAVLVDIPMPTDGVSNPEWGVIDLMNDDHLFNHGVVRLNKWQYVDPFALNEDTQTSLRPGEVPKFSIVNGELVSRVQPTDNFRIRFARDNNQAPEAIRLKAELSRLQDNPDISPSIDSYRLRFQFGD